MSNSSSVRLSYVSILTGDPDGVGFEVSAKALGEVGPQKGVVFFLFRDRHQEKRQPKLFKLIDKKFARFTFKSVESALGFSRFLSKTKSQDHSFIMDLALEESAIDWVIMAARLCHEKIFTSMVTGPLSKTLIRKSGYPFVGHTGVFRHFYPQRNFFMAFKGHFFNVILATDHIALKDVEKVIENVDFLKRFFAASLEFKKYLKVKKKLALIGLNPHAGEKGIIGTFEQTTLDQKWFKKFSRQIEGPLSPDAAFLRKNWNRYSGYLALYHDQGLIPFKAIHGQDSGVHITLGLPFVRTSVDHGTAKDLYNKNRAVHLSMRDAITYNIRLIQGKKI